MVKIHVDLNRREGDRTIAILHPEDIPDQDRKVGAKVILYEPGIECEAILRHGTKWEWVADIVAGTLKETC